MIIRIAKPVLSFTLLFGLSVPSACWGQAIESIPVPAPEPPAAGDLQPTPAENPPMDLEDLSGDDDLTLLEDSDEFQLEPIPDSGSAGATGAVISQDDQPLMILQEDVSQRKRVHFDPNVAPSSYAEPVVNRSDQPLVFEAPTNGPSLEPIVDPNLGQTPRTASPNLYIPTPSRQVTPGRVVSPQPRAYPTTPNVRTYPQYAAPSGYRQGASSPRPMTSSNAGTPAVRTPQGVPAPTSSAMRYRTPRVVQEPVTQQRVQSYRAPATGTATRGYVVRNPSVTRVQQTGPRTYRVTTTTQSTSYVPVQVQVPRVDRPPVYRPGTYRPSGQVAPVSFEVVEPPAYIPGRPIRNVIRGVFR